MKSGFVLPRGDARAAADLAHEAEAAGWDGFFVWEPVWGVDAWVSLAAAAMTTTRIRLGTLLTPVSRMRPWKLASETATLDNLSCGRVILSVGLGATDTGFESFGEETGRRERAGLLDEGLDILTGLWRGQPFNHQGKHYTVTESSFLPPPPPVQQPRIPIWVVGAWHRPKSMRRVLRYDGLLPHVTGPDGAFRELTPADVVEMRAYLDTNSDHHIDIIVEGRTPGDDPATARETLKTWEDAGATWWIEALWEMQDEPDLRDRLLERIRQGPPLAD